MNVHSIRRLVEEEIMTGTTDRTIRNIGANGRIATRGTATRRTATRRRALPGLLIALGLVAGCAGQPRYVQPLPTAEQRAQFGAMGVVAAATENRSEPREMVRGTGRAMGRGAARGALGGAALGAYAGLATGPFAIIVSPALAIAGAVGGAAVGTVAGAAQSESSATVEANARAIRAALTEAEPDVRLRMAVVREGAGMRPGRLVALERPTGNARYQALADQGVQSVLWLNVTHFGFHNEARRRRLSAVDPSARFMIGVAGTVRTVQDGRIIYTRRWGYRGESRRFSEWGENGGARTREAIETGIQTIARQIAADMFLGQNQATSSRVNREGVVTETRPVLNNVRRPRGQPDPGHPNNCPDWMTDQARAATATC
jgi:hypothetical protein